MVVVAVIAVRTLMVMVWLRNIIQDNGSKHAFTFRFNMNQFIYIIILVKCTSMANG